jgi:hypothetical protein
MSIANQPFVCSSLACTLISRLFYTQCLQSVNRYVLDSTHRLLRLLAYCNVQSRHRITWTGTLHATDAELQFLGLPFSDKFGVVERALCFLHSLYLNMPIKRSQSAPQPIESLFITPNPRAATFRGPQTSLPRSKSYLVDQSATNSPLSTPWIEREDPFSLGGFFPASPRAAPEEEEQWKWLRKEEDEDASNDDKESVSSFFVDDSDSATEQLENESAEETIKSEDKFGVLSLSMFCRF